MNITKTTPVGNRSKVFERISKLTKDNLYVGVPRETNARPEELGNIGNACIAYLNEYGSQNAHIPSRPFLIPGVTKALPKVIYQFKIGMQKALAGDASAMQACMIKAGTKAVDEVRDAIKYGDFTPLAPSTIANRWRKRPGQTGPRRNEEQYATMVDRGMDPGDAQSIAGIRPLINTSELLGSISFVIRETP